jgi:hypothetical protein
MMLEESLKAHGAASAAMRLIGVWLVVLGVGELDLVELAIMLMVMMVMMMMMMMMMMIAVII